MQPLIPIERAEEGEDGSPAQPEPARERAVRNTWPAEHAAIDAVRNNRNLVAGDAAPDDIGPQSLTDRCHGVGALQRTGLDEPRRGVTQTGRSVRRVAGCRVFP